MGKNWQHSNPHIKDEKIDYLSTKHQSFWVAEGLNERDVDSKLVLEIIYKRCCYDHKKKFLKFDGYRMIVNIKIMMNYIYYF